VSLTNSVTEVVAGTGATLEHDKLQLEGARAFHVGTSMVQLGARAVFASNAIHLGGALVRNTVGAVMGGEGSDCT
jgi:Fe-S cluster assembly protein SufD